VFDKGDSGQLHRLAGEQWLVALSAIGFLAEPRRWHTVDCVAVRANKMQGIAHEIFLSDGKGKILPHVLPFRAPSFSCAVKSVADWQTEKFQAGIQKTLIQTVTRNVFLSP
jgi:hypothetical protein